MKTIRYTLLSLVALLGLTACTHNEGDIGIWFGTWQIEEFSCAEMQLSDTYYNSPYVYLQFQGDMVTALYVSDLHDEKVDYGTWHEGDGTLDIDFPDPNVAYSHVLGSFLVSGDTSFHFTITERSASHVTLTYYNTVWDQHWTLRLRKSP